VARRILLQNHTAEKAICRHYSWQIAFLDILRILNPTRIMLGDGLRYRRRPGRKAEAIKYLTDGVGRVNSADSISPDTALHNLRVSA
jgi:hypothetical protein